MSLKTPLKKVHGLGSAKEGTHHFIMQRLTAIALVPLLIWFAFSLASISGGDYQSVVEWVRSPFVTIMLVLLVIAGFYHAALGLQVIIEDYIHVKYLELIALIATKLIFFALGAATVVAILRTALGVA